MVLFNLGERGSFLPYNILADLNILQSFLQCSGQQILYWFGSISRSIQVRKATEANTQFIRDKVCLR